MCKKMFFLICVVLLLGLVNSASGTTYRWTGGGGNYAWVDVYNWLPPQVPGPCDIAYISPPPPWGPLIDSDVIVGSIQGPRHDSNDDQDMSIVGEDIIVNVLGNWEWARYGNGTGAINITGSSVVNIDGTWRGVDEGHGILQICSEDPEECVIPIVNIRDTWALGDGPYAWVDVRIHGGQINVGDVWRIGPQGSGVVNIKGGTITVAGAFEVTCRNEAQVTVNMSGGALYANSVQFPKEDGLAILNMSGGSLVIEDMLTWKAHGICGCLVNLRDGVIECGAYSHVGPYFMDIEAGTWIIGGDLRPDVEEDIQAGYITAYNGTGSLLVDYNTVNPGRTTVSAEPSDRWQKVEPPPDVDKSAHHSPPWPPSCWLATAANMLAAAGYGTGATIQQQADSIYGQLLANFGTNPGWTDTAMTWWLASAHNIWAGNPYDIVTVYGNKNKVPWANSSGARFLGNELRRCQLLGLSISWPRPAPTDKPHGGHAIAGWGDDGGSVNLLSNPSKVIVTDSDRDAGGDVQTYTYDSYSNPNPGGYNEGSGWYINYNGDITGDGRNDHPFVKHIVTLCPTDDPNDNVQTQKVVGSIKIHQDDPNRPATDLHYKVGTDTKILSYKTTIDWPTSNSPVVQKDPNATWQQLTVDWDVNDNPIPPCTYVTITTEFVVEVNNAVEYNDVYFTYPEEGEGIGVLAIPIHLPGCRWKIDTPQLPPEDLDEPSITGGYVIAAFDIIDVCSSTVVAECRLIHEYDYDQDPEHHTFTVQGVGEVPGSFYVGNFKFGHSYGIVPSCGWEPFPDGVYGILPDVEALWEFNNWMTHDPPMVSMDPCGIPSTIQLNWEGRLAYPEGEDYVDDFATPECTEFLKMDLNQDCYVNFKDVAIFAGCWLCATPINLP